MAQSIDSLAMLAHAYAQLTQLRKNQIRPGQYVSKIFLHPKADGSHRLILNLKMFNESIVYYFKMDSIHTTKVNGKELLYGSIRFKRCIPVKEHDQNFLQFEWEGTRYQFTCLPNGLSSAHRNVTKISIFFYFAYNGAGTPERYMKSGGGGLDLKD